MDFIFVVVGQIKFIIFEFKMFELESLIRGFMFNMYRGRLAKERYFIALTNREDSYAIAVDILSKFRMNKNT